MEINGNSYNITERKDFTEKKFSDATYIEVAFQFAWDMTFGKVGKHRGIRTGGQNNRKNGQKFINTFQGKLGEFAVYQELKNTGVAIEFPDLSVYELGRWDISDFTVNNIHVAVKSTKFYGNLLLLETGDWDINARYIPSDVIYDYLILVRIKPDGEKIMKSMKLLYSDKCNYDTLKEAILNEKWVFDIPGFITHEQLKSTISQNYIIPQNALLNGKTPMDATNYFVEAGNMNDFNSLFMKLR